MEKDTMRFENKISIDGVTVIIGIVGACLWLGSLNAKVNQLGKDLDAHTASIEKLSDNQVTLATSIASIASEVKILDERNRTVDSKTKPN